VTILVQPIDSSEVPDALTVGYYDGGKLKYGVK
jgi:hypothetical protein